MVVGMSLPIGVACDVSLPKVGLPVDTSALVVALVVLVATVVMAVGVMGVAASAQLRPLGVGSQAHVQIVCTPSSLCRIAGRGDEGADKVSTNSKISAAGAARVRQHGGACEGGGAPRPRRDSVATRCTGQRRGRAAANAKSCCPRGGVCAVGVCACTRPSPSRGCTQGTHPRARELTLAWACPCRCSGFRA